MDSKRNDHRTLGGPFDVEEDDVYRNETDAELHGGSNGNADVDQGTHPDAVRAAIRYGRDTYLVASDVDPDEDNYAPGVREQD